MRYLWVVLFWGFASSATAQYFLGISHSNYAGTDALYLNPAHIADSRHKVFVNLSGFDAYLHNNYLRWEAPYSFGAFITNTVPDKYRGATGKIRFDDTAYLTEKNNGKDKHLRVGAEYRGPSVLVTLNDKSAIALGTRIRSGAAFTHTSESVARLFRYGTNPKDALITNEDFGTRFYLNTNGFAELSGTYAHVYRDNEEDFFKIGITVKHFIGLHQGHILAEDVNYRFVPDSANPNRQNVLLQNISAKYGLTNDAAVRDFRVTPAWLFGNAPAGNGWGMDLGLVYEYRPDVRKYSYREKGRIRRDATKNKYLYRVSVSLLDIGGISYKNPAYVSKYFVPAQNRLLNENRFNRIGSAESLLTAVNNTLGATDADRRTKFWMYLPTSLQSSVDVHVQKNWYVNAFWLHSFGSNKRVSFTQPSVLAITPRYESRWIDFSLPISLTDNYRRLGLGIAARVGVVYVGSDMLTGLLNIGNPKSADFYFGANIPIFRKKPQSSLLCLPTTQKPAKSRRFK